MTATDPQRVAALRAVIADFLRKRLDDKLEKIKDDDAEAPQKRSDLRQQYQPAAWLDDAARRVAQIQAVTHSLKPIHPDAKGTNLYSPPRALQPLDVVGSHCLGDDFAGDVVGNAAALDVFKFLKLSHEGRSLLELTLARDADLAAALSDDLAQATAWMSAFAGLTEARGRLASHTFAKQLYWPIGEDPHEDTDYHLLAPMYASSLAHRVYQTLQEDRFSDEVKEAREARRKGEFSARPVREYPQLAIQKLGGTKPQNISQLNSERRGENALLASLPPVWRSGPLKPLHHTDTMFHRYGRREEVRRLVKELLDFLKSNPDRNLATREHRGRMVDALIDEFLQFTAELREQLPPGWSDAPACRLDLAERHWLDPDGLTLDYATAGKPLPTDTPERIAAGFANWLNARLRDPLPTGDPEFLEWRKRMLEEIKADQRGNRDDD